VSIADRILKVRKNLMLNQNEFAELIGISQSMVSFYESGRSEPDRKTLKSIADKGSVSFEWLLNGTDSRDQAGIISTNLKKVEGVFMPIVSRVHAGDPAHIYLESEIIGQLFVQGGKPGQFALQMEGDSMYNPSGTKSIQNGDIAVIDPSQEPITNDVVLVVIKGRQMIKQLKSINEKQITLSSFNPDYADLKFAVTDVEMLKRVVEVHRRIKL